MIHCSLRTCFVAIMLLVFVAAQASAASQDGAFFSPPGGDSGKIVKGDLNGDSILDVSDVNLFTNLILEDVSPDSLTLAKADLTDDGVIDISDMNRIIIWLLEPPVTPVDTIPVDTVPNTMGWVKYAPDRIIGKMIIAIDRNRFDFGNGRMLVWKVQPGDSLRLTVDHDNSINVSMCAYTFYAEDDSTTWTAANTLAFGPNIRSINGRDTMCVVVPDEASVMVCSGFYFENGRIGDGNTACTNPFTAYQLERWADTTGIAPRPQLRVLAVGNSFTTDELSYMPYVIQSIAPDVDLHFRLLVRNSGSLADWVENVDSTSLGGRKNRAYDWQSFPGRWSTPVESSLREQIANNQWNVVTMQQVSTMPYWDDVEQPLRDMVIWLRDSMQYEGKIGWLLTHAYSDSSVLLSPDFPDINTSDEMWQLNQQLAQAVMESELVDVLLPCGTAVQNARHTRLDNFSLNHLCEGRWDNGQRGGNHLQEGVGPFVAACAGAGALLQQSPIGAQVSLTSAWRIPDANPIFANPATNPTLAIIDQNYGGLGMDPESQALGAWCADQALQQPFQLIEPQEDEEE